MKAVYRKGSIAGTQLSASFNKTFTVELEGQKEHVGSGHGTLPPMFEQKNDPDIVGVPFIEISLPNERHGTCEIELRVSIPTQTLGVFNMRPIKKEDIKAIRENWNEIRQQAIDDAFGYGENIEPLFEAIDIIMTANQVKLYTPNSNYPAQMRLAYTGKQPSPTKKEATKQIHPENEQNQQAYAVGFAYNERGEYWDEAPLIMMMTPEEVKILTKSVIHQVYDQEELDELEGKFYTQAELLMRIKNRPAPTMPVSIYGTLLIWLQ